MLAPFGSRAVRLAWAACGVLAAYAGTSATGRGVGVRAGLVVAVRSAGVGVGVGGGDGGEQAQAFFGVAAGLGVVGDQGLHVGARDEQPFVVERQRPGL